MRHEVARGDARLALELLARRYPERWSKNRAPSAPETGEAREPEEPPLDLSRLSDKEFDQFEELRRRALGE